jgi:hypothetical protein
MLCGSSKYLRRSNARSVTFAWMHRDFTLHRDALVAGGLDTARLDKRLGDLESRCPGLAIPAAPKDKPPGYEKLVRNAAVVTNHVESRWAYLWNAASGAAHGQNWFGLEAFDVLTVKKYEPGYFGPSRSPIRCSSRRRSARLARPCNGAL